MKINGDEASEGGVGIKVGPARLAKARSYFRKAGHDNADANSSTHTFLRCQKARSQPKKLFLPCNINNLQTSMPIRGFSHVTVKLEVVLHPDFFDGFLAGQHASHYGGTGIPEPVYGPAASLR